MPHPLLITWPGALLLCLWVLLRYCDNYCMHVFSLFLKKKSPANSQPASEGMGLHYYPNFEEEWDEKNRAESHPAGEEQGLKPRPWTCAV